MSDSSGMVDISGKSVTVRTARADGCMLLGHEAFRVLKQGTCTKGDVLATARIAAIQAVKSTPMIVPMCHCVLIEAVKVEFELNDEQSSVTVVVAVKSSGKTGVEMEALCGVAAACLTIYDMLKYTGKDMTIERVRLIEKAGGARGHYKRPS